MSREEQQIGRGLSDQLGLTMACFFSGQRTVAGVGSVIHEVACTRVILTVSVWALVLTATLMSPEFLGKAIDSHTVLQMKAM